MPGACSVYCAAYYLQALYDGGQAQAALGTMTSDSETSWRHMIDLGAGSTMEAWDPSIKGNLSYSHAWATGPDFVVPQDLFGISPLTPGWGTILIAPQPGSLTSGTFTEPTARGEARESFTQANGGISVTVTIPTTATALVALPGVQPGQTVYVDGQPVTTSALTPSAQSSPSPMAIQDGATVAVGPGRVRHPHDHDGRLGPPRLPGQHQLRKRGPRSSGLATRPKRGGETGVCRGRSVQV